MPPYFSLRLLIKKERIKSNIIKDIYSVILKNGFKYKSGYWYHEKATYEEIVDWNQRKLESNFKLASNEHVKKDYMQILFSSNYFSEFRAYWMNLGNSFLFSMIIPESDILINNDQYFDEEKLNIVIKLAISFWKSGLVDFVETCLELDEVYFSIEGIKIGKSISINPFAIIPSEYIDKVSEDIFKNRQTIYIENNGILIETYDKKAYTKCL